jgi:uncharacterized membrane protein
MKKAADYLNALYKMSSGDASRARTLVWSYGVASFGITPQDTGRWYSYFINKVLL